MSAYVEVNECRVFATDKGAAWWIDFRTAHGTRIADVKPTIAGSLCHVACDDRDHADWLAGHMTAMGLPASAVRVLVNATRGSVR